MASFTREEALTYLEQRGLLTKARESYTTAYAKRLASSYSKATSSGRSTSRKAARGKAGPTHIIPKQQLRPLQEGERRDRFSEQYITYGPEVVGDLRSLKLAVDRRRTQKGLAREIVYTMTMTGLTSYKTISGDYAKQTFSMYISQKELSDYLKNHKEMPVVDFVNIFWQPLKPEEVWESIEHIALNVGK